MTILATLDEETDTKTSLMGDDEKGYKVVWNEGDVIAVHYNNSMCNFTLTSGAGTTTAEFTATQSLPDGTYDAYYGVDYNSTEHLIVLPGSVDKLCTPMKASLTIANGMASVARFKNLCGQMRLKVTGYGKFGWITVTADKNIRGPFDIDSEGNAVVKDHGISSKMVTVSLNETVDLSSKEQTLYVPIPQGEYSNVKIEFHGPSGALCQMTLNQAKTLKIKRSEIYPLNFNVNIISGYLLRSGLHIVKWVQLWANGPKWATYNVGADNNRPEDYGKLYDQDSHFEFKDHATDKWGDIWKSPHRSDLSGLRDYCTQEFEVLNGVRGTRFTGKGIFSENSIFLPYAGAKDWLGRVDSHDNTNGWYFGHRNPGEDYWSYIRLEIRQNYIYINAMQYNDYASIRPVVKE